MSPDAWPQVELAKKEAAQSPRPGRSDDPPLTKEELLRKQPMCFGAPTVRACIYRGFCARNPACNE
jgi:hypothetical protein